MVYLTMVRTFAVRALSMFLAVGLTAASAFPPCCWSMSSAHGHLQSPDSVPSDAASVEHHHDHHGSADSDTGVDTASTVSAVPAYDCNAEFVDTATTTGVVKRTALRQAPQSAAAFFRPTLSRHDVAPSDASPPGASVTSGFLSPLRI